MSDGNPAVSRTEESDSQCAAALAIFDELVVAAAEASDGLESGGDTAWISFLDSPRVLHLYVRSEPNRVRYEFFDGVDETLSGVIGLPEATSAIKVLFEARSPLSFLKSHSLEIAEGID